MSYLTNLGNLKVDHVSIISIENLTKNYGQVEALSGLNLDVKERAITGFLGPNGAGKTTTISIMFQFISQDSGEVNIFDMDVRRHIEEIKKRIGYIPDASLPPIRGSKLLKHTALSAGISGSEFTIKLDSVLKLIGGKSFVDRNTKNLSKGQKQRIKVANAIITDPELIIADEPTTGLDPVSRQSLLTLFKKLNNEDGKTIFFSNHVISEIEKICNNVIIISKGKVALEGTIHDIINELPVTNSYSLGVEGISEKELVQLPHIETVIDLGNNMFNIKTNENYNHSSPEFLKSVISMPNVVINHFSKEMLQLEDIFMEVTSDE